MKNYKRSGDVNLHPVKQLKGKEIKHNGEYVLARGEATGSVHLLKVKNPEKLIIKQDKQGRMYFQLFEVGEISHTADHETIKIEPGIYTQVFEREVDHFANSVVRRVQD